MANVQGWITIAISATLAFFGVIGGVYKFAQSIDSSGGDLVARLDKRVKELEDDLDTERQGRASDNERWSRKFEEISEKLQRVTTELEVTRVQFRLGEHS